MSWIESLADKVLNDTYFIELFTKAEKKYAFKFFQVQDDIKLTDKEYIDLLRFADILSRSSLEEERNTSYRIISLLFDEYKANEEFIFFSNAILTKLGNFPAMNFLKKNQYRDIVEPLEITLEKSIKETYQKVPDSDLVFTDAQYQIFEALKNNNHFSFSGPTSLGKSFIIESFIKYIISEHKGIDNIIILVPTRALINQVVNKLKNEFKENKQYKVLAHPTVPTLFIKDNIHYVFVFTPERLISYLSEPNNPKIDYMFIDEAQKIVSSKDSRSPLYYHAIIQAERKSIKLFFASPNIPNAEVFLQLFEKSTDEKLNIKESPVAQNRFFIDLLNKKAILFSDLNTEIEIPIDKECKEYKFSDWLKRLGSNHKNIIYCNSVHDTIEFAMKFASSLPDKQDVQINDLISLTREYIHKDYFLIDCLKKGVAFHFGRLPQRIREQIEKLFREKVIDYIFCTSTLLEGVNLPAKNIFILNNAIGVSKFTDLDFWNLAGRAGRLTKELSGNIICARIIDKRNRWDNLDKDLLVLKKRDIKKIEPTIIKGQEKFYVNLGNSLSGKAFTRKNYSQEQKSIWDQYANIALIHEMRKDESILRANFIKKNPQAKMILKKESESKNIPHKILSITPAIKAKYQNEIWETVNQEILTETVDSSNCLYFLKMLYLKYNWAEEESGGHNPMAKYKERLEYFACLMSNWMNSMPLNLIINNIIKYHENKGYIWDKSTRTPFTKNDRYQVNIIINNLISDIDTILRYKLKNYFLNYYLILEEKFGQANAGANWAEYLEYGTTDIRIIELQDLGLPRHLAKYILDNHSNCLSFEEGDLVEFNESKLKEEINKDNAEYFEILQVLD